MLWAEVEGKGEGLVRPFLCVHEASGKFDFGMYNSGKASREFGN
jgi:hypothetical protein